MAKAKTTGEELPSAEIIDVFRALRLDADSKREVFVPPPMPSDVRAGQANRYHLTASAHSDPPPSEVR